MSSGHLEGKLCDQRKQWKLRKRFRDLEEDIHKMGKIKSKRVNAIIEKADQLNADVTTATEGVYDARLCHALAKRIRGQTDDIDTNEVKFVQSEFALKVAASMGMDVEEKTGWAVGNVHAWVKAGELVSSLRVPWLSYLLGSFDMKETKVAKEQYRKLRKEARGRATKVERFASPTDPDSHLDSLVTDLHQHLIHECSLQGHKRLGLFPFLLDPNSFGNSVENLFHLAFLVRERKVLLSFDETGLPQIEPVFGGSEDEERETESDAIILTMTVREWRRIVEAMGLKEARVKREKKEEMKERTQIEKEMKMGELGGKEIKIKQKEMKEEPGVTRVHKKIKREEEAEEPEEESFNEMDCTVEEDKEG